jgi:hypothetical protein
MIYILSVLQPEHSNVAVAEVANVAAVAVIEQS